jgi:hypothetical protein
MSRIDDLGFASSLNGYKGRKAKFDASSAAVIRGRDGAGEQIADLAREYKVTRPTNYRVIAA